MSQSSAARHDRIRVSQACNTCREKKARCDGTKPICGRCVQKAIECHYGVTKRVKTQQVMQELATKVAQYESILKKNIPSQQKFYHIEQQSSNQSSATPPTIDPALVSSTAESTPGPLSTAQYDVEGTFTNSPTSTSRQPSEILSPLITAATISNVWGRGMLDTITIPPRYLLERATRAFLDAAAMLFTFFDAEEWNTLFDSVYTNTVDPPSKVALTQTCAAAAVGCQFYPLKFDEATRLAFLSVAKLNLEDCIEEEPLPSMRILALLSMYFISENQTASIMYASMGLRLARLNRDRTLFHDYPSTPWQRVSNSLVFLDCWLCSTTGHTPSSQHRQLYSSIITIGTRSPSIAVAVQLEMTKIAVLSSSILQDVYHARFYSTTTVNSYKNQLQQWLLALPKYMRLDQLVSANIQSRHLRSIFVVHLLYLNTVILVYRRVIVELSSSGLRLSDPGSFKQTQAFLEPCLWTGRQVGTILGIALSQGEVLPKCWMYIHTTYSTCSVLLYFITNRLLQGDMSEELTLDLAAAQQCMDVLSFCAEVDKMAKQYLDNMSVIHQDLTRISNNLMEVSRSDQLREEMLPQYKRLHQLTVLCANLLTHPFDGGFRRAARMLHAALAQPVSETSELPLTNAASGMNQDEDDEMLSPNDEQAAPHDPSHFFWKDFLTSRQLHGLEQDNRKGKGKDGQHEMDIFPFATSGGVVFGS